MFHRLKHMMLKAKLIELGFYYSLQLPERKAWRRQTLVRCAQFDERQQRQVAIGEILIGY